MARYACEYTNLLGVSHPQHSINSAYVRLFKVTRTSTVPVQETFTIMRFGVSVSGPDFHYYDEVDFDYEAFRQSLSEITGHDVTDITGSFTSLHNYSNSNSSSSLNGQFTSEPQGVALLGSHLNISSTSITVSYKHQVSSIEVNAQLTITLDRLISYPLEYLEAFENSGFALNRLTREDYPGSIRQYAKVQDPAFMSNPQETSFVCINIDTLVQTEISVSLPDESRVEVTIIDGDPPMTSLANGNSSIFIDPAGAVRMQAATADGAPLASFFLTEHGAGGFNVNGSFFANGNREASFGGGGHTFTLDERGYTFRHDRENVTFTFEEIKRLKDLIG